MPATTDAAAAWLARADPDRAHADRWMRSVGLVLLPLGIRWCAVKVDEHDGLAAAADVNGPVIHDPGGRVVYFLVPVGAATTWDCPRTELLGLACWLAVPAPQSTEPPGVHWVRPPDGSGLLVDPAALRAALSSRASYRAWIGHTAQCATCRAGGACVTAVELGRAWRQARR
ncbi:hypothetical protein ACFV2I_20480 [Streptomyces microflavus]|uniref:hypothetical protein n=1 Tax=Streptomyces microflavus TaxID=1919 RepID=UPI0035D88E69